MIIGAKTMEQLKDNLDATKVALTQAELTTLEQVSRLPEEYPGWMLYRQGQYRADKPERKD